MIKVADSHAWVCSFTAPSEPDKNGRSFNQHRTAVVISALLENVPGMLRGAFPRLVEIHSVNRHGGPVVIFDDATVRDGRPT